MKRSVIATTTLPASLTTLVFEKPALLAIAVICITAAQAPGAAAATLASRGQQVSAPQLRASLGTRAGANGSNAPVPLELSQLPLENFLQLGTAINPRPLEAKAPTYGKVAPALLQFLPAASPMQPEPIPSSPAFGNQPLPAASFIFTDLRLSDGGNNTAGVTTATATATSATALEAAPQQLDMKQVVGFSHQVQKQTITPRSWYAFTFSFAFVVKAMCMLSNVIYQAAPIPQIGRFNKVGDTGEVDAAPFISIMYGGCQWCFYGMFAFLVTKKSGFLVLVYSNLAGAFLGAYYLWGFQINCKKKDSLHMLFRYYKAAGTLAFLQLVAMLSQPRERALFFCGLVSSVCSVVAASSLLTTLPTVFRTRSSASMNVPMLIIGVCSSCLWLVCGFFLWDAWIIIPNSLGFLFQALAICVVLRFPSQDATAPRGTACFDDPASAAKGALSTAMASISTVAAAWTGWLRTRPTSTGHANERLVPPVEAPNESDASSDHGANDASVSDAAANEVLGETGGTA